MDDTAELKELFDTLPDAIKRARRALGESGLLDERYLIEDVRVEKILERINELMNK